jgi:hypothetical protein
MASKMPSEVLEKFQKDRAESQASSGDEAKMAARKRARSKARKVKESRGGQG